MNAWYASHIFHVLFDGKALTEDSDLQQELQLGAEARRVWKVCSTKDANYQLYHCQVHFTVEAAVKELNVDFFKL